MTNDVANSSSEHELERRLAESWPVREWCDTHVVLGVSGGADSVAMLRAMVVVKELYGGRGRLFVAHLNHRLRGSTADADEAWVKALCERLQVAVELGRVDVAAIAGQQGDGWEAAARSARYDFLTAAAERVGGRFVATAHTANDQVETVLHRILRGTGIDGLAGMSKVRPLSASVVLVRPLLDLQRSDVLEYLAAIGQDFRTDATNEETRWTRNRLRHDLLPELREHYNPCVDEALSRLAVQAGEAQSVIAELAATIAADCVVIDGTRVEIDRGKLRGHPAIVVREVCKIAWRRAGWPEQSMGFDQWWQLATLVAIDGLPMLNLPGHIRAKIDGQFVVLEPLAR